MSIETELLAVSETSIHAGELAGASGLVWRHGESHTVCAGWRDMEAKLPVERSTIFEDGHAGAEYVLTGPESLTQLEQVSAIGYVIGRSLRIEEI